MTHNELTALDRQYTLQTYGRFDVDIDHGKGAVLWDLAGREYVDFASGIGVASVGYGNEIWANAVAEQARKLCHTSNLFYNQPYALLARRLCERSGMSGAFFSNSGAEGNEGAIKLARKYSFDRYGTGRGTILTLKNSFHGRTVTTLAATGQDVFHQYFFPFTDGFRYAEPTLEGIDEAAGPDVCAVLIELVQGEGGVFPLDKEFVRALAGLCAKRDWLLMVDEVQTGVGRTGTLFAFQQYGILPDVATFAKGIAGGLPMGGFLVNERCRNVLGRGTHASTFGGNPVCAAAALAVQEILDDEALRNVTEQGNYLRARIDALDSVECLGKSRGLGLMTGVEVREGFSNVELAGTLMNHGLLVLTAGHNTLRFLPPLTITRDELDRGLDILIQALR